MSVVFLIPLAIALVTTWISTNANDETVCDLAGSATAGSVVISLVLAPWQVKLLLLLILLLVTTRSRFKPAGAMRFGPEAKTDVASTEVTEPEANDQPQLCYRGISYGSGSSTLVVPEGDARETGQDL